MLRHPRLALLLAATAALAVSVPSAVASQREVMEVTGTHLVPTKQASAGTARARSPQLTYHGGTVFGAPGTVVTSIFWGPSWAGATYRGDVVAGLDSLYGAVGGSAYLGTTAEYAGSNGPVSTAVSYTGHLVDTATTPASAPSTKAVLAEVAKQITAPVANGYYPVYTDVKRGSAGYCAWHSWGSIGSVPVQFAFFFDLAGDPGCDPGDTSGAHSQALAAVANVTGHELSEAATDPRGTGWTDSSGSENADKCAWTFHAPVVLGSTTWRIQGNWSNAAYTAKTGYGTTVGCIDGS